MQYPQDHLSFQNHCPLQQTDEASSHVSHEAAYLKHSDGRKENASITSSRKSIPTRSTQLAMTDRMFVGDAGHVGGGRDTCCGGIIPVTVKDGLVRNPRTDNIITLPACITQELERQLDPQHWMKLVAVTDNTRFKFDVYAYEDVRTASAPTCKLLLKYSSLGMSVQTLVELLTQAKLYSALECLRKPELLQITRHPEAQVTVEEGGTLTLRCEADGFPPPRFQWYHYRNREMMMVPHETTNTLTISQLRADQAGSYVCQVNNSAKLNTPQSHWCKINMPTSGRYSCVVRNSTELQSEPVLVNVVSDRCNGPSSCKKNPAIYKAQAKVALLVGTGSYHTACTELPAARNDVQALEKCLNMMDFMVITLLDLSKEELIQHVHWFCELLDEGVYGVFFYIGHGFDRYRQSFLIPWDAEVGYGTKDCVHLEKDVLSPILLRKPSMCLAIIDVCRSELEEILENDLPEDVKLPVDGTTCIFYATSPHMPSYEDSLSKQGIFMTHLLKVIGERVSVQELHSKVLSEIQLDPMAGNKQYPMIENNLNRNLSLHDPIDSTGHTKSMNRRRYIWESAMELPQSSVISLEKLDFVVHLTFTKRFSNYLSMSVLVVKLGSVSSYEFKVNNVPPEITGKQDYLSNIGNTGKTGNIEVHFLGLQRLHEPLRPTLTMELMVDGKQYSHTEQLDLGEPLVAKLHLNTLPSRRVSPDKAKHKVEQQ